MKKNYSNKELKAEETKIIPPEIVPEAKGYVCKAECVMVGVGHFKHGEKIYDPGIVKRIKDNPNFEKIQEEQS